MPIATSASLPLSTLELSDDFISRHIGPTDDDTQQMLRTIEVASIAELINETIPNSIRLPQVLELSPALSETDALQQLKEIASRNKVAKSLIGMGYAETITPSVILRNVLENPGWYTAYTPYQAEIAQGRLEALLNYQQMIIDLTGLEIANASLLDEATAAAEAMSMAKRVSKSKSNQYFVDAHALPQTIDVIKTRAKYFGFELIIAEPKEALGADIFGALLQYPNECGEISDISSLVAGLKSKGVLVTIASDLMALVLLKSPGAIGADIAIGSTQRFGIPMGFGGPHAAYFATRDEFKRSVPGRIIGVSVDSKGKKALRMALQTREQHIRREKANSNICTSQVLLANIAGMYAVYHGPRRLKAIAERIHRLTAIFAKALKSVGIKALNTYAFDTLQLDLGDKTEAIYLAAQSAGFNLRKVSDSILGISFNEKSTLDDVKTLIAIFADKPIDCAALDAEIAACDELLPDNLRRTDAILSHPVFNSYQTEHEMLRYLKRLQNKDLALDHSMISLGSCTMKLNATSEMLPISWPEFANIHPFAPASQTGGYQALLAQLKSWLATITGFDTVSLQSNSGAQGEYAGIVTIRRYQESLGQDHRDICLIPKSAHGTNPATAQMCGLKIVVVECDSNGNVDVTDLRAKASAYAENLACLMITYPSTHGVFEESIIEICKIIHEHGGQVYMDGANLNAQVGLTSPGFIGADVSHMNLHKTFAIPHGGGGPGMGPIGVKSHLAPFLPAHCVASTCHETLSNQAQTAVSAAPWGSASILPISWMYIAMLGQTGVKKATEYAILNANYIATCLNSHYPVLYTGKNGRVAHECILDIRPIKSTTGISEIDIAKRLMDYGFHAPTVSFPVAGTMMIEPTESESKAELDRFIEAMISIRGEIEKIAHGVWPADDNPLCNAPHTQADIIGEWQHPYSRETAVTPLAWVSRNKFWPSVNRIDDVYGDRNLFCACSPIEDYQ